MNGLLIEYATLISHKIEKNIWHIEHLVYYTYVCCIRIVSTYIYVNYYYQILLNINSHICCHIYKSLIDKVHNLIMMMKKYSY